MNFKWLKSIPPKGLYGRAALILVLPIITTQLVVSVVFIQRHFDGVTQQMTLSVALELAYLRDRVNGAPDAPAADATIAEFAAPLALEVMPIDESDVQIGDLRAFDDLTGKVVATTLRRAIPEIKFVDLKSRPNFVLQHLETNKGPYEIVFNRGRVSASNPHQLLVLMLVISLLMTVISFIFLRNQVRPIRRLARAAEAFGKGRSISFHVSGATEVRQAGQSFIAMRDRIERQIEQRTLMLSGVSHDLRTPLTRLKLGLSLSDQEEEAAAMIRDVDDMEQMLDEFLAFARGDSLEQTERVDPLALAQQVVDDAKRGQRLVEFANSSKAEAQLVAMRPNAVRRALENLVTNALRYGSRCRLTVESAPGRVFFVVEDNGPSIPMDQRQKATRPFERLDAARNQDRGSGVGLGLAIAMDIAISHGGGLELSDGADLGGLKVTLSMPG